MILNPLPHRRGLVTLLLTALAGTVLAQQPTVKVTCGSARVQGLQYDSASSGQLATWSFSASMTHYTGQVYAYFWYLDGNIQASGPQYTPGP